MDITAGSIKPSGSIIPEGMQKAAILILDEIVKSPILAFYVR
jgi:hypothetical protein